MTEIEQFRQNEINELAYVLDKAKLDAISTIGSLNNGFGQWYAKAAYDTGYRKINDNCAVITKDDLEIYKKQAVKEFAEKLKERLNLGLYEWQYAKVNSKVIDELLKEYER